MSFFVALVIDGALAGAVYALIALAFVLVYKASAMINFALGEWVMFGGLLAGTGMQVLNLGAVGALLFAAVVMAALAASFSHIVVRRLVGRPAIAAIMVTLGLGMLMRGAAPFLFGETAEVIPRELFARPLSIAGLSIAADKLIAAAVAALCTVLIGWFYRFSRTGLALGAIADDPQAAMSAGIDVERHLLIAWTLTGVVAVIAGVLWTLVAGSGFGGIVPSLTLLAVLAVRPHGLFGRPRIERA